MKRIAYYEPDGNLCVVHPVINTYPAREQITEEKALERAMSRLPDDAINPQVIEADAIPRDRTYRGAWKVEGNSVVHDMKKAREIHRDILRSARAPRFVELDIAYQRADEDGDMKTKNDIAAKKQKLRDVTSHPGIGTAKSIDDLKLITLPVAMVGTAK